MNQIMKLVRTSYASVNGAIEQSLQRWSDRRKGITPERRAWLDWSEQNLNPRADTVQRVFFSFKHIIEVDPNKFFSHEEMGSWIPVPEFRAMSYPNRELGNHCIWSWFRGNWADQWWQSGFLINEMFGGDHVFTATNNEQDALWIAMKWGK